MSDVALIVIGPGASPARAGVAEVRRVAAPDELTAAAAQCGAPLIWLLDARAEPAPGALEALLTHAPAPGASLAVDRQRHPHEELLGGFGDSDIASLLGAVGERRVPLRHLPITSLLVEREDVLALQPPDARRFGRYAWLEWTARLFAQRPGFLVPASVVQVDGAGQGLEPVAMFRLVRSGAWRRTDALRPLRLAVNRRSEHGGRA